MAVGQGAYVLLLKGSGEDDHTAGATFVLETRSPRFVRGRVMSRRLFQYRWSPYLAPVSLSFMQPWWNGRHASPRRSCPIVGVEVQVLSVARIARSSRRMA